MGNKVYLVALFVFVLGCTGPSTSIDFEIPQELYVESLDGQIILTQNGQPVEGAQVTITGTMSHGMEPVIAQATDLGDGKYSTSNFAFTMTGDWKLSVEAQFPDGTKVEKDFDAMGVTRSGDIPQEILDSLDTEMNHESMDMGY